MSVYLSFLPSVRLLDTVLRQRSDLFFVKITLVKMHLSIQYFVRLSISKSFAIFFCFLCSIYFYYEQTFPCFLYLHLLSWIKVLKVFWRYPSYWKWTTITLFDKNVFLMLTFGKVGFSKILNTLQSQLWPRRFRAPHRIQK